MIIQGSNEPIVLEFKVEQVLKKVDVALFDDHDNTLKEWSFESEDITDNTVVAPLSEVETAAFPAGALALEVKWLDDNDSIWHGNRITLRCSKRSDKRKMLGGDSNA